MTYSVQIPKRVKEKVASSGFSGACIREFWAKLLDLLAHNSLHEIGRSIVAPVRVWVINVVVPCEVADRLVSFTVWVDTIRSENTRRVYDVAMTLDEGYVDDSDF